MHGDRNSLICSTSDRATFLLYFLRRLRCFFFFIISGADFLSVLVFERGRGGRFIYAMRPQHTLIQSRSLSCLDEGGGTGSDDRDSGEGRGTGRDGMISAHRKTYRRRWPSAGALRILWRNASASVSTLASAYANAFGRARVIVTSASWPTVGSSKAFTRLTQSVALSAALGITSMLALTLFLALFLSHGGMSMDDGRSHSLYSMGLSDDDDVRTSTRLTSSVTSSSSLTTSMAASTSSTGAVGMASHVTNAALQIHKQYNATFRASLRSDAFALVAERELELGFSVPVSLTRRLPVALRYSLLTELQAASVRPTHRPPQLFMLHVVGASVVGRLRAVATALTYAHNTGRLLVVLWDTARGADTYGDQLLRGIQPISRSHPYSHPHSRSHLGYRRSNQQPRALFDYVHRLRLAPNISHWSEFAFLYFTSPTDVSFPLDNVAKLATRHIFCRSDNAIEGKYSAMLPGVMKMPTIFNSASENQREWDLFFRHWTFPDLDETAVADILNRVYAVPWVFLDNMRDEKRRLLLRLLDRSKSKRALFVHAQYGMGNRLRALGSAMAIARVSGHVLVLIWEPDVHLDCRFSDLFVNEFVVIEKLNLNWPPLTATASADHAMRSVDFYNFMRNEGVGRHNPMKELVNPRAGRHVYAKSAYVIRSSFTPRILSMSSKYWKIMREELIPRVDVMLMVSDPLFARIHEMVGVHIRGRTIRNDIKGVGQETYGSSSATTDHWRRRTGLKTFESKIMRLSNSYSYFVAADMKESIESLERTFGVHRIFSLPRGGECVSRDVECAKLALADILLLSRVPTLLGSHWSSFSEAAVRFSGRIKVLLAGVHFG